MEKYTTWVQAVVEPSLYPFIPGATIRIWGFDFKIYPNKKLCVRMHNDFIASQVKAGRVTVMDSPPPGVVEIETPDPDEDESFKKTEKEVVPRVEKETPDHKKIEVTIDLPDFTMDIGSYFGHGNMGNLMKALEDLKASELRSFAKSRFEKTFPVRTTMQEMKEELRDLTDKAIVKILADDGEDDD